MAISIDEMMADLEAADAAGDTELANAIAARIKAARGAGPAPTPTGGPVPGAGGPATQGVAAPVAAAPSAPPGPAPGAPQADPFGGLTEEEFEREETARLQREMLKNSSTGAKLAAGAGQSLVSTGRGIRQLWNYATGDEEEFARLQEEERRARALDAPLLSTGAGRTGQILGHVAQAAVPVGAGVKAASLGGKIAVNAGLGAGMAALAPTVQGESRAKNTAVGGVIGGALPVAGATVGLVSSAKGAALRAMGKALGGGGTADLKAEAVREAARKQISNITKRVQIPLAPIQAELQAIQRTYGTAIPKAIRNGIDDMVTLARSGGKLKGDALAEARTAILREASKAAQSTKKGAGTTQTGLDRLRRTLDNATDEALDSLPPTIRDRLFGAPAKRLEAARRQYRTGQAPEVVAPYGRAAARAAVEALRRPGPRER